MDRKLQKLRVATIFAGKIPIPFEMTWLGIKAYFGSPPPRHFDFHAFWYTLVKSFAPHLAVKSFASLLRRMAIISDSCLHFACCANVEEGMNFHWKLVFIVFRLPSLCTSHLHGFVHQSFACKSMISKISPPRRKTFDKMHVVHGFAFIDTCGSKTH